MKIYSFRRSSDYEKARKVIYDYFVSGMFMPYPYFCKNIWNKHRALFETFFEDILEKGLNNHIDYNIRYDTLKKIGIKVREISKNYSFYGGHKVFLRALKSFRKSRYFQESVSKLGLYRINNFLSSQDFMLEAIKEAKYFNAYNFGGKEGGLASPTEIMFWQIKESISNLSKRQKKPIPNGIFNRNVRSGNERIVSDIFSICVINFQSEVSFSRPDNKYPWFIDYQFSDGRYFEVFGIKDREEYNNTMLEKITTIPHLWYIDVRKGIDSRNQTLISYAAYIDFNSCTKDGCGLALFPTPLTQQLTQQIPLLQEVFGDMNRAYLTVLKQEATKVPEARQRLQLAQLAQNTLQFPNNKLKSLEEITSELNSKYESVEYWSDEEKIAVYFKTPDNLQQIINSQMQKAAINNLNWYKQ